MTEKKTIVDRIEYWDAEGYIELHYEGEWEENSYYNSNGFYASHLKNILTLQFSVPVYIGASDIFEVNEWYNSETEEYIMDVWTSDQQLFVFGIKTKKGRFEFLRVMFEMAKNLSIFEKNNCWLKDRHRDL